MCVISSTFSPYAPPPAAGTVCIRPPPRSVAWFNLLYFPRDEALEGVALRDRFFWPVQPSLFGDVLLLQGFCHFPKRVIGACPGLHSSRAYGVPLYRHSRHRLRVASLGLAFQQPTRAWQPLCALHWGGFFTIFAYPEAWGGWSEKFWADWFNRYFVYLFAGLIALSIVIMILAPLVSLVSRYYRRKKSALKGGKE